jgi:adenylate cyclase class IV
VRETEIKYRLEGRRRDELRRRLGELGARRIGVEDEENRIFDHGSLGLLELGIVLRVRILGGGPRGRLTFKGPPSSSGGVKSRVEREVAAYGKRRETWTLDGVEVALDRLDFGEYCELEGDEAAIRRLGARLGLGDADVEPQSYPSLSASRATTSR